MMPQDGSNTLVELLSRRAQEQSTQTLYTFLNDGESQESHLTFGELDRRARSIAVHLLSAAEPGDRALLLFHPGLDFISAFFGCLYAGIVAIPAYPPRNARGVPRIQVIASDAQAKLCLTSASIIARSKELFGIVPGLERMIWSATDELPMETQIPWQSPPLTGDSLAYLQYTSGSTSSPKGVMVSHGNLLHNLSFLCDGRNHTKIVSWLPFFHDMGLIYGILQGLYGGFPSILFAPASFLQKPLRWLQALSRTQASTAIAPNFAYELCVEKISAKEKESLDLSHWTMALNAAEPVRAETLERFAAAFASTGFRAEFLKPSYGLAEATLGVSIFARHQRYCVKTISKEAFARNQIIETASDQKDATQAVGCGQWAKDQRVVIANPETFSQCPPNAVGEIWLSGPSVAKGYWRRSAETKEIFQAFLSDSREGPFLRTGDLGFILDGELFITGRLKDLIIIRGANHYPQDIELTVQNSHPALQADAGAAFSVDVGGEERLVIVQELVRHPKCDLDEAIAGIRAAIADVHGIQVYAIVLVRNHSVPKTSSGKIQRKSCRTSFLERTLETIHSWISSAAPLIAATVKETARQAVPESRKRAAELIQWLRGYAETRINSRIIDERRTIPPYVILDFGNQGLFGLQAPERYGGLNLTNRDLTRVIEQMAGIDLTLALLVSLHNTIGMRPIQFSATEAMREEFLPKLAQGRQFAAFALTEPGAGSNPQAIAATASASSHGWLLKGTKIFSGAASWAGILNVFCKVNDGGTERIAGFAIPQGTPGLRQGGEALTMGMRGMIQNTVYLDDVQVGRANLLGDAESGMEIAQNAMMFARLVIGAMSLGGMKRCAQLMVRYANRRHIRTGLLLENPVTLRRLADLTSAATCLEALISQAADLLDHGLELPPEVFIVCKTAGTEFLWQAADDLMQVLGGRGYIETNLAPQILRDARVMRIFEGPTETLNAHLGSQLFNKNNALRRFLVETLNASAVADQLESAAINAQRGLLPAKDGIADVSSHLNWIFNLAGQAGCFGLLLAAVQKNRAEQPSPASDRAAQWASQKFEEALRRMVHGDSSSSAFIASRDLRHIIDGYGESIGDIDQCLAGEETEPDPLVRRVQAPIENSRTPEAKTDAPAIPRDIENRRSDTASIQAWLTRRIALKFGVSEQSIAMDKPFTAYGMDSVTAVELSQDLAEWLQRSLPATLVWSYPTVRLLVDFLGNSSSQEGRESHQPFEPPGGDQKIGSFPPVTAEKSLDTLSEDELAGLLAEELELAKERRA